MFPSHHHNSELEYNQCKWNVKFILGKTDQWAGICKGQVLIVEIKRTQWDHL